MRKRVDVRLDGDLSKSKHHSRKHVDYNLRICYQSWQDQIFGEGIP